MAKTRKAEADKAKESALSYDKVFAMYDEKIAGSTKYEDRTVQKQKRTGSFVRSDQTAVVLSSQQFGWRQPIDDLKTGQNRTGVCKRTFMDYGHL